MNQSLALMIIIVGSVMVIIGLFFETMRTAKKLKTDPFMKFER